MFSNFDNFNFSAFNGQSILSGRSTANTKKVTWISLRVLIRYMSFIYFSIVMCIYN